MIQQQPNPLLLPPHQDAYAILRARLNEFCSRHDIAQAQAKRLQLVLEELLANTIAHGACAIGSTVRIELHHDDRQVHIRYHDCGLPFDPLRETPPEMRDAPLAQRPVGGLGWTLIREYCVQIQYTRSDDENRLQLYLPL